jgi:hypothetical protein
MHNSNNSVSSKASFTSSVLAQAVLSNIPVDYSKLDSLNIQELNSRIHNANVSEVPTFHTTTISLPEVTAEMRATLSRLSSEAYKRALLSDKSRSVLRNTNKYGIGYIHGIQYTDAWESFVDKVYEWEALLEEADDLHVDWADNNYDPQGLSQAIEEEERELRSERQAMYREYIADRALGV